MDSKPKDVDTLTPVDAGAVVEVDELQNEIDANDALRAPAVARDEPSPDESKASQARAESEVSDTIEVEPLATRSLPAPLP